MPLSALATAATSPTTAASSTEWSRSTCSAPSTKISVVNEGENGVFNRGSFFFREERWTTHEMASIMYEVAERSVYYYFAKYGEARFS